MNLEPSDAAPTCTSSQALHFSTLRWRAFGISKTTP
jgi:hypothetical protein